MTKSTRISIAFLFLPLLTCANAFAQRRQGVGVPAPKSLHEVNPVGRPDPNRVVAIAGATLIDGRGGTPIKDAVVVVRGDNIVAVGSRGVLTIPAGAETING